MFIDDCNMLGEIPENVRNYINYEVYAHDLEINYSFVVSKHGVFEYAN